MAFCMNFKKLPRCGAKSRSNFNLPCKQVAMKTSGRCYYHGGASRITHGKYTKTFLNFKRRQRFVRINVKQIINEIKNILNHKNEI